MKYYLILIYLILIPVSGGAEITSISKISNLDTIHPETNIALNNFKINVKIPGSGNFNLHLKRHKLKSVKPQYTLANGDIIKDHVAIKLFRGTTKKSKEILKVAAASYKIKGKNQLHISFISGNRYTKKKQFNQLIIPLVLGQKQAKLTSIKRFKFSDLPIIAEIPISHDHELAPALTEDFAHSRALQNMLELEISVDGDSYWYSALGSSSNAALIDHINTTETVYQSELGVTFNVVRLNVFTGQSFGTSNPYSKLCNYQYYTTGENSLSSNANCTSVSSTAGPQSHFGTADAYYLFTGQNLDGSTVGIAFYSAICRSPEQAVGLVQYIPETPALLPITFAHELGHNLSAVHDSTSTYNGLAVVDCTSAPEFKIMGASLSSFTKDFSDCSLNTINNYLANYNTCMPEVLVDIPDPTPSPSPSANPSPSPSSSPAKVTLNATLSKGGLFVADISLDNNNDTCLSKLYLTHKKTVFDDAQSISFSQNIDLDFSVILKATTLANIKGRYPPIYLKAVSTCSGPETESSVVKINPHKITSNKALTPGAWAKRLVKKLKNKYEL